MCPQSPVFSLDYYCSFCHKRGILWVHFPLLFFSWRASNTSWCRLSLSILKGWLLIWGNRPSWWPVNSTVAGLRSPAPISIEYICNKAKCKSLFVSRHFNGMLKNFIHTSICPLLLWWYVDVIVCWMFVFLQKSSNVSAVKFIAISDTMFFRILYSTQISLVICTTSSADRLFTCFTIGNLLW